jgi:predicted nucleotidyltransferase component of viral defense system
MISDREVLKEAGFAAVDEQVIEKDYVLSWLLVAIAESQLARTVVFKGGTALKKVYFPGYRFSEDLDFTLVQELTHDDLVQGVTELFPSVWRRIHLDLQLNAAEENVFQSTKVTLNFLGPLGAKMENRRLDMDFTRGERMLDAAVDGLLQSPYSDYPSHVVLPTYTKLEILTEKLCALTRRVQPRDLYDVYYLFESGDLDTTFLPDYFRRKCDHKGYDPSRIHTVFIEKQPAFGRLWKASLAHQVRELPHFEEVVRAVRRHVRQLELG